MSIDRKPPFSFNKEYNNNTSVRKMISPNNSMSPYIFKRTFHEPLSFQRSKFSKKPGNFSRQEPMSSAFLQAKKMIRLVNSKITPKPRLRDFHELIRRIDSIRELRFLFKITPNGYLRDTNFYRIFISKGKKGGKFFILATRAFENCKEKQLATDRTNIHYINIAGNNGEVGKANKAFDHFLKKTLSFIYSHLEP